MYAELIHDPLFSNLDDRSAMARPMRSSRRARKSRCASIFGRLAYLETADDAAAAAKADVLDAAVFHEHRHGPLAVRQREHARKCSAIGLDVVLFGLPRFA
jgi:hypothetical protein